MAGSAPEPDSDDVQAGARDIAAGFNTDRFGGFRVRNYPDYPDAEDIARLVYERLAGGAR